MISQLENFCKYLRENISGGKNPAGIFKALKCILRQKKDQRRVILK